MNDEILVGHEENFFAQAGKHKSVSHDTEEMITGHKLPYDSFFVSTTVSTMPDLETFYTRWWQSKSRKLGNYDQAHQTLGDLLVKVVNDFTTHDENSAPPAA
jgi:hypothetical protein